MCRLPEPRQPSNSSWCWSSSDAHTPQPLIRSSHQTQGWCSSALVCERCSPLVSLLSLMDMCTIHTSRVQRKIWKKVVLVERLSQTEVKCVTVDCFKQDQPYFAVLKQNYMYYIDFYICHFFTLSKIYNFCLNYLILSGFFSINLCTLYRNLPQIQYCTNTKNSILQDYSVTH